MNLLIGGKKTEVIDLKKTEPTISKSLQGPEKFVKRKVAIGRFSNETRYGKSVFSSNTEDNIGKQASDILSARLAESNKFILLERNIEDLEIINRELSMNNLEGLNIPADYLILGSISEFGRKEESNAKAFSRKRRQIAYATVNIRLVDIYSGQIIYSDEGSAEAYAESETKVFSKSNMGYDSTLNDKVISAAISKLINNIIENLTEKPWRTYILDFSDEILTIAGGELLFNLRKNFDYKLTGVDVDEKLLRKAKTKCSKDIIFLKKDIFKNNFKGKKYDIIIFSGVLSIFQNGEKIFKNLMKILKKKGKIFIFDSFNIYSYNLNITATKYNKNKKIFWYKNMYSLDFIEKEAKKFKKKCKFFEFKMKANLKRNNKDLSLGWTETLSGRKIVTSGLGLIQNQFWVKIY